MKLLKKLETLIDLYPEQLWLEFSDREKQINWEKSQQHSYDLARFQAYLNSLSAEVLINWLKEEADLEENPQLYPTIEKLNSIWEFINGTTITIGKTKIVLIPTTNDNLDKFNIPQEWVDIPGWEADYYLPIQLDLTENWLRVWGYTTHQQLKTIGKYNSLEKTYSLEKDDLIEDLNVMLVAREFCDSERVAIPEISKISENKAHILIENWGVNNGYSPRFLIPFTEWASLITDDLWREELYQHFLNSGEVNIFLSEEILEHNLNQNKEGNLKDNLEHNKEDILKHKLEHNKESNLKHNKENNAINLTNYQPNENINNIHQKLVNISDWLEGVFSEGWLKADSLFNGQKMSLATRSLNSQNSDNNQENMMTGAKLIDLGIKLGSRSIVVLMACVPTRDDKITVTVQVYPPQGENYLPPNLKLSALDEDNNLIQDTVISRDYDNCIQLKRFTAPRGVKFSLEISLNEVSLQESFIL
ncbi:DUF1822 family protein [Geminocystis herdmanii]|uniref:DUF1822 family protein n=1 Tax=Geminocystis herdmanii TaxID=669359 RepID=UPI000346DB91|nr:DUF1822 family protein [Geminocystis herdmanii]